MPKYEQVVNDNCLPCKFQNVICRRENNKIIISSDVKNLQEINDWVVSFGKNTNTQWNARSSCPEGSKIICSKKFVCHHSSFMKVSAKENRRGFSKNANCRASILVVVKLDTINTRKKDHCIKKGLQAAITIENEHTHSLQTAETARFLQAKLEIQDTFFEYFNDGMTISEAKKFHEQLYEFDQERELILANGRKNPTYRTVQYWYDAWRKLNLGPRTGEELLPKLIEKQSQYKEKGVEVRFSKEPLAVAIVTPMMKRGHASQFSKEICFVDSTSACDAEQHSVTFVMAPCAAGAVPLGIIITRGQTYESYCKGFQLLQEIVSNTFHPKIFLTDNSVAQISALNAVFPNSATLLCILHVLQAVWRWLWDCKHNIPKEDRRELMQFFQKILYSRTPADANEAFDFCINNCIRYANWIKYVESYWTIKEKWCLAWRNKDSKGHYTNNFCEISIRLFKDNVLCRVKAYNVIALIDVVSSVLEEFYRRKLREFANSRSSNARLYFLNIVQKSSYLKKSDIARINHFEVPSEKCKENSYLVNVDYGCCSCFQGIEGKFCKHQCAIYRFFQIKTKCFPPITTQDRYTIAKLALGDDAPALSFYDNCNENKLQSENYLESNIAQLELPVNDVDRHFYEQSFNIKKKYNPQSENCTENTINNFSITSSIIKHESNPIIEDICMMIKTLHSSFGSSTNGANIFKKRLETIKTEGQFYSYSWKFHITQASKKCSDKSSTYIN